VLDIGGRQGTCIAGYLSPGISLILILAVILVVPAVIVWYANRTPIPQTKVRSTNIKIVIAIFLVFLFDLGFAVWLGGQVLSCLPLYEPGRVMLPVVVQPVEKSDTNAALSLHSLKQVEAGDLQPFASRVNPSALWRAVW
jgi:hypothetical protein